MTFVRKWYRALMAVASVAAMAATAGPAFAASHATVRAQSYGTGNGECPTGDQSSPYSDPMVTYATYTTAGGIDTWGVNVSGLNVIGDGVSFIVTYGSGDSSNPITPSPATVNGTTPQWFSFTTPAQMGGQPPAYVSVIETMPKGNPYDNQCASTTALTSIPYGQLPEVPWAAGLPVLGLAAAGFVLYRRRGQSA